MQAIDPTHNAQLDNIRRTLIEETEKSIDWVSSHFLQSMPPAYFREIEESTQLSHIRAILTSEAFGLPEGMIVADEEQNRFTVFNKRNYPGQLYELLNKLPRDRPLRHAKVYTSEDSLIVLDVFEFGISPLVDFEDENQKNRIKQIEAYVSTQCDNTTQRGSTTMPKFRKHISVCSARYINNCATERIWEHFELVQRCRESGNAIVQIQPPTTEESGNVSIVMHGEQKRYAIERVARYFGHKGIDIRKANLETFHYANSDAISLFDFQILTHSPAMPAKQDKIKWDELQHEITRLLFLNTDAVDSFFLGNNLNLQQAEILVALCYLGHQVLAKVNSLAFSREQIIKLVLEQEKLSVEIVNLFIRKFTLKHESLSSQDMAGFEARITAMCTTSDQRKVLLTLLKAVESSIHTNIHVTTRRALCIKLTPAFLANEKRSQEPFCIFYVHGRSFDGFHVRFSDIARGGVRIVKTTSREHYTLERDRLYDEVYGLAFAQHLKNKDIPEGGAKGVILCEPKSDTFRCGLAFVDALLDFLVVPYFSDNLDSPDNKSLSKHDMLYLGPDENISNELITAIVERAQQRRYISPDSFMSSKPGAGINHKEYGVTSEGLIVFLDVALRNIGINPNSRQFSVKITGGTNGDVGGNLIKFLIRDYGENVNFVGIADGSGSAEDPHGLSHEELLRLINADLPISQFDIRKLNSGGRVSNVFAPGGLQDRNSLHNRLVSDVFIPSGGRPRTINIENWEEFLTSSGTPSAKIIIEGANLFITRGARKALSAKGVVIVKDSSANKCGVICSSFEVAASLLLSQADFLKTKDRFVKEVIAKLRKLSQLEADLLFREAEHDSNAILPEISERLGFVVNKATDAIMPLFENMDQEFSAVRDYLFRMHLPAVLIEKGNGNFKKLSKPYLTRMAASFLATRIIYREGLCFFEHMEYPTIRKIAGSYIRHELKNERMIREIQESALPNRDYLIDIIRVSGAIGALRLHSV